MYSNLKRDPLTVDDKVLSRRALLFGAVAVAGAAILPVAPKAIAGASIGGGILRTGGVTGLGVMQSECLAPALAGPLLRLQWWLQDLSGTANTWLQGWVRDAVGKETYSLFESWFSGKETTL